MALSPSLIASSLLASNPSLSGQSWILTTNALGLGIFNWINSSVTANTLCTGTLGVGFATGKVILLPNIPLVNSGFSANGIASPSSSSMAQAIAICLSTLPILFTGASPIVGTGACNILNIVAPYPTLLTSFQASFPASGCPNPNPLLLNAFALSISNLFLTGTGVGIVAGSPSIVPSSSPIICKLG